MPAEQTVLLPLCIGLTLVGLVVAVFAFRRGRRGRALQGIALALAPVALYLTGLLRLVWDAVVAVADWARDSVFDLTAWVGFGVLALCVVLWVVGGVVARRRARRAVVDKAGAAPRQVGAGTTDRQPANRQRANRQAAPAEPDEDMAEIEALLRSRGIS